MTASHHCAFCSIVPPYLLKKYAQDDSEFVRRRAAETLRVMAIAHTRRHAASLTLNLAPPSAAALPAVKKRRIFDCQNSSDLTADKVMEEGDPASKDVAVSEAYDFAGITWDFFQKLFQRNSIDDRAMTIVSSVHYSETGAGFDNAYWNTQQMVYGDGGVFLNRTTQCLDVVAHELTHGVTQYSAGLPYASQSGALNEHFSDVFGAAVRQWHENETDPKTADWFIGKDLLVRGGSLRSMSAPGTANPDDPQPDHMTKYVNMSLDEEGDWGGVHYNSGIPNKAFYLAAVAIGRPTWETAATIWYKTLTQRLKGETTFSKCAYETISVARDFVDNATAAKVAQAWVDVGVIPPNTGPAASLSS